LGTQFLDLDTTKFFSSKLHVVCIAEYVWSPVPRTDRSISSCPPLTWLMSMVRAQCLQEVRTTLYKNGWLHFQHYFATQRQPNFVDKCKRSKQ
jgi:hypothetical protein